MNESTDSAAPAAANLRRPAVVSILFGALGALISVTGSWVPSLWGDEAASQLAARRTIPGLVRLIEHVDAVHGTYYLFMHFWIAAFGYSAFAMRFPSCVAIGICVGLVVWLCFRLSSPRVALAAGLICSVLPRLTYAGAEARSFSFDAAFAAALCVVAIEIARRPGRNTGLWIVYGTVVAAATYMFLYTGLMTFAVGAFLVMTPSRRHLWMPWLISSACGLSAALPIIVIGFVERAQISYLQTSDYASWDVIFRQLWFGNAAFAWLGWILMVIAAAVLVLRLVRKRARPQHDIGILALLWVIVPTGILLIANVFHPLFTARYAAITAPGAAVLMALGADAIAATLGRWTHRRSLMTWASVIVMAVVIALAVPNWIAQRGPYSENQSDWNTIAATVHKNARAGDAIVFDASVRPSRRPRLAYDTAPLGSFGPVHDVLLKTSSADNYTWYAATYTVDEAEQRGRFDGTTRVWVVEYRTPEGLSGTDRPDTYGMADLERLGFTKTASYTLHASTIYLLTRSS